MNTDILRSHESLVIDVGGTHTDVHLAHAHSDMFSERSYSLPTPPSSKGIIETLGRIIHSSSPRSSVLIGVPGPLRSCSNSVFCPPLGFALHKADFTALATPDRQISVVNDLACLASMFLSKSLNGTYNNTVLVTIGTSLGLAKISQIDSIAIVDTYESAHSRLSHSVSLNIAPFEAKQSPAYARDILNASYLICMYESTCAADKESQYWNYFLPCIFEELLDIIVPFQPIDNLLIYGGFVEWLHSEGLVYNASSIIRQLLASTSRFTEVDFLSKQDCLAAKIVTPFNTLVLNKWSI